MSFPEWRKYQSMDLNQTESPSLDTSGIWWSGQTSHLENVFHHRERYQSCIAWYDRFNCHMMLPPSYKVSCWDFIFWQGGFTLLTMDWSIEYGLTSMKAFKDYTRHFMFNTGVNKNIQNNPWAKTSILVTNTTLFLQINTDVMGHQPNLFSVFTVSCHHTSISM